MSGQHPTPDPLERTADEQPGRGAGHVIVHDDRFLILGSCPSVTVEHLRREPREQPLRSTGPAPDQYSTGDATGSDPAVGEARIHAPAAHACDGFLLSMWSAFRGHAARPSDLQSVEWYTSGHGFLPVGPPALVPFPRFRGPGASRRRWVWLDPHSNPPSRLRGLLVLRCSLRDRTGYVVEIQRRTDESGEDIEFFSGLVFTLRQPSSLDHWVRRLLSALRHSRGVFPSAPDDFPGRMAVFKHPPVSSATRFEVAARNASAKLSTL